MISGMLTGDTARDDDALARRSLQRQSLAGAAVPTERVDCIRTFDPRILLGDRLGLALYCRLAEDHLAGRDTARGTRMYDTFVRYFHEHHQHTAHSFLSLVEDIRAYGFDPVQAVYANPEEYTLKNGSHRIAAAIALGIERIPYHLSFRDNVVPKTVFGDIFGPEDLASLLGWQDELIERCDGTLGLRCRVRRLMRNHPESFAAAFSSRTKIPVVRLYQGHEALGLVGKRPTQERFAAYGLEQFLREDMTVLEMGCNNGFLSLEIAARVRHVTGFDVDPAYIAIGKMVGAHLGRRNCDLTASSVEEWADDRRYDCVVACAVHGWLSIGFAEFVARLRRHVAPGGILLLESHELDCHPEWAEQRRHLFEHFTLLRHGLIDDVDGSMYASEMREYLVLRRTS